jgi:hypothetical protein
MKPPAESVEERLLRLQETTAQIKPRADFSARVMLAVQAEDRQSWAMQIARSGKALLPMAALAAILGVAWAVQTERAVDTVLATASTVEVEW